ncbi:MAG TPA: TonB-dependent receptor [Ignavibacteriales bacterium]|nr:TonB-dependent receptor [Ignavibacteriales bacterium]
MIKKIIILAWAIPCLLLAQENTERKQQSVELPEFVITGVERVSLPTVTKPKAELVPVMSEEFFKPVYSPEDLPIAEISNPVKKEVTFNSTGSRYKGALSLGAGYYRLPGAELTYGSGFDGGAFFGRLWTLNDRAYVPNSNKSGLGLDLSTSFFSSDTSGFLPGTVYKMGGGYDMNSYKFFASDNPDETRNMHKGNLRLSMSNLTSDYFKISLDVTDNMLYLSDRDFGENLLWLKGGIETGYNGFKIAGDANVKYQNMNEKINGKSAVGFMDARASLKLKPTGDWQFGFGLYYATTDSSWMLLPQGFFFLKISNQISLLGELVPQADFLSAGDLAGINKYYNLNIGHVFQKNPINLNVALKYEFDTYFEIEGGVKYSRFDNYAYFRTNKLESRIIDLPGTVYPPKGKYDVSTTKANRLMGYANLLFHAGPYGSFYGKFEMEDFQSTHGSKIPFTPAIRSSLSYGYDFTQMELKASLELNSSSYADIENRTEIPAFADMSLRLGYKLQDNFSLFGQVSNLFNRNNYYWYGYKEKPFDIVFGIDYRW